MRTYPIATRTMLSSENSSSKSVREADVNALTLWETSTELFLTTFKKKRDENSKSDVTNPLVFPILYTNVCKNCILYSFTELCENKSQAYYSDGIQTHDL